MRASRRPRAHTPSTYDKPFTKQVKVQSHSSYKKTSSSKGSKTAAATAALQRLVMIAAGCAVLVVLAGFGYYSLFLPTTWDENTSKNIVIVPNSIDVSTNSILYASISYKQDKVTLNSVPADDTVKVPGGYGNYPLKSVFPLLGLDHADHQTIVATYSNLIGVPIDEVWLSSDESVFSPEQTANQLAQAILLNNVRTGLGLKDRVQLYRFIKEQQPDETSFSSLQEWQQKQMSRFAGQLKNCRVALVNTTSVAGLGRRFGQVLERSGVVVVRLSDTSPTQQKSSLTIQPGQPDCVELSVHLKQLFPDQIEVKEDPEIMGRARSEAEVVLGQDLGDFLQ